LMEVGERVGRNLHACSATREGCRWRTAFTVHSMFYLCPC
jgi:hypothetical protein